MPSTATDRLDGLSTSVAVKAPVKTVTTDPITLNGLQTIDGVALAAGDRCLVKDQVDTLTNGIYEASTGNWTRAPDFDGNRDIVQGTLVLTADGRLFRMKSSFVAFGTSAIEFYPEATMGDPALTEFIEDTIAAMFTTGNPDVAETDMPVLYDDTNNVLVVRSRIQLKYKTSNESRTNNIVLTDDSLLAGYELEAGKPYRLRGMLYLNAGSTFPDIQLRFNFSDSPSFEVCSYVSNGVAMSQALLSATQIYQIGGGTSILLHVNGMFIANAGVDSQLALQWCQNADSAVATTVYTPSWVEVEKLYFNIPQYAL